jgi:hypothetical protein
MSSDKKIDNKTVNILVAVIVVGIILSKIFFPSEDSEPASSLEYELVFPAEMIIIKSNDELNSFANGYDSKRCKLTEIAEVEGLTFTHTFVIENDYFDGVKFALEVPGLSGNERLKREFDRCTDDFQKYIDQFNATQES